MGQINEGSFKLVTAGIKDVDEMASEGAVAWTGRQKETGRYRQRRPCDEQQNVQGGCSLYAHKKWER